MSKRIQINQAKTALSLARRLVPGHPLILLVDAEIHAINHGSDSFAQLRQLTGKLQRLVGINESPDKQKREKRKQSSSRKDRIQIVQGGSPQ
jgi:hypothetical protein